jgi:hypothetical protein
MRSPTAAVVQEMAVVHAVVQEMAVVAKMAVVQEM